jgi:hypothetical protein
MEKVMEYSDQGFAVVEIEDAAGAGTRPGQPPFRRETPERCSDRFRYSEVSSVFNT